jgi:transposase
MAGFVEGMERGQSTMFPARLDDYVNEDNPVRAVDAFVDGLDLGKLGFTSVQPLDTGRPGYFAGTMLKIYIYGYLNRIPSSRRLERECQRNIELIWLTGKLAPDHKTIADFRKENGKAIIGVDKLLEEIRAAMALAHLKSVRLWSPQDTIRRLAHHAFAACIGGTTH